MDITLIKENETIGFHCTVSDKKLEIRSKMSNEEILNWMEEKTQFIYEAQTQEERERMRKVKGIKW